MDDLRARDKARLTQIDTFTIWLDRLLMYFPNPATNPPMDFDAITRAKDILVLEHARVRRIMTKLTVVLDRLLVNHALTLTRPELHTMSRQWALLNVMGSVYAFMFRSTGSTGSGPGKNTRYPHHHHVAWPAHERRAYVVLETIVLDHAHFKSRLKRSLEVV